VIAAPVREPVHFTRTEPTGWLVRARVGLPAHGGAILGDSLIYLIGAALIGIGNVVLLPLYTRCLSASHFGMYALLDVTILIVVTITQLGLGITYLKWFADLDASRHGELLGSAMAACLASSTIGGVALFAATRCISSVVAGAGPAAPWLLMAIVPLECTQGLILADLRARRRSVLFCLAAAGRLLAMSAASVWFVQVQKQDIAGVLLGRAIGDAAGLVMLGALSLRFAALRCNLDMLRGMLGYGLPLVWTALVGVGLDASGRYFLARHTGLEQVAIYTLALKMSCVLQVGFLQPFGTAWSGIMFQLTHAKTPPASITRILSYAFVTGMTLAAGISILSPIVLPLFGRGIYVQAAKLIPWLLLPPAFRVLEYWSSLGLYLGHRTGWIAIVSSMGAALNVAGLLILLPCFGALGAAFAWIGALLATILANAWLSGRYYYRLPHNWRAVLLGLALWAAGAVAAGAIPPGWSWRSLSMAAAASVMVIAPALGYCAKKLIFFERTAL